MLWHYLVHSTDTKAPKDEFQDYDVVYVVDDLDNLTSDLAWLDQFGTRIIEQHNILETVVSTSCFSKTATESI